MKLMTWLLDWIVMAFELTASLIPEKGPATTEEPAGSYWDCPSCNGQPCDDCRDEMGGLE